MRRHLLLAGLVGLICSGISAAAEIDRTSAEHACRTLVADYAYYRDRFDGQALAELFAEDGILIVPDGRLEGRRAIAERLDRAAESGPPSFIRHFMSNVHIEVASDGQTARGVSYAAIYTGTTAPLPQVLDKPAALGEYHDRFVRGRQGWRFAHREFVALLVPKTSAPATDQTDE